jgi:hypothetical protein
MIQVHGREANDQALFDRWNQERFDKATVCERCKERPPTDIMRYTAYCAVCRQCADELNAVMRAAVSNSYDDEYDV